MNGLKDSIVETAICTALMVTPIAIVLVVIWIMT